MTVCHLSHLDEPPEEKQLYCKLLLSDPADGSLVEATTAACHSMYQNESWYETESKRRKRYAQVDAAWNECVLCDPDGAEVGRVCMESPLTYRQRRERRERRDARAKASSWM